jgi:predicted esterase
VIPRSAGDVDPGSVEVTAALLARAVPPAPRVFWPLWTGPAGRAADWACGYAVAEQRRLGGVLADAADALGALATALRRVTEFEVAADRVLLAGGSGAVAARLRADARAEAAQADRMCAARLRGLPWVPVTDAEAHLVQAVAARGWTDIDPGDAAVLGALRPVAIAEDLTAPVAARLVAAPLVLAREGVDTAGRSWLLAGDGRVAEVWGDVSHASHVLLLVPGTGTSESDWAPTQSHGDATWNALREATDGDAAVVAWLGAPEPPSVEEAALQHWAKSAAPALTFFVDGLPLAPGARLTLVGHSYGAVVAGLAVHEGGLRPAALVGVAPAGFGPQVHDTGDLGGVPTYVVEDARDPIRDVPVVQRDLVAAADLAVPFAGLVVDRLSGALGIGHLGDDPVCLPGAVELASNDDDPDAPALSFDGSIHSSYFDPGSDTVRQIAAVAAGTAVVTVAGRCALRRRSGR